MKKLIIAVSILSGFLLSACDSKEDKIAYYKDKKNLDEYVAMIGKCARGAKDAKDCDIVQEINRKNQEEFNDKYGMHR